MKSWFLWSVDISFWKGLRIFFASLLFCKTSVCVYWKSFVCVLSRHASYMMSKMKFALWNTDLQHLIQAWLERFELTISLYWNLNKLYCEICVQNFVCIIICIFVSIIFGLDNICLCFKHPCLHYAITCASSIHATYMKSKMKSTLCITDFFLTFDWICWKDLN